MSEESVNQNNIQLDQYLNNNLDRYIEETIRLCAQPSVSATGYGVRDCTQLVAEMIAARGVSVVSGDFGWQFVGMDLSSPWSSVMPRVTLNVPSSFTTTMMCSPLSH